MADEQIIYLSPDEELTNVRERLERVPSRRIILVIPQQTHLRSLVGWKLLHARARELSKDVLIISSDRQIRSVVKAAGFKVADSLGANPDSRSGGSAQGSRSGGSKGSGRTNVGGKQGKPSPRQRGSSMSNRGETAQASRRGPLGPRQQPIQQPPQSLTDYPTISDLPTIDHELDTNKPRGNDPVSRSEASSTFGAGSTGNTGNRQFGPNYDFRVGEIPSIHPLSPTTNEADDEEPDYWLEDISHAQSLRDAAQQDKAELQQDEDTMMPPADPLIPPPITLPMTPPMTPPTTPPMTPPTPQIQQSPRTFQPRGTTDEVDAADDPLSFRDEMPSSPLPEHHGSIPFEVLDDAVLDDEMPDISDDANDIRYEDIEDLGDQGNFVESPRSWADVMHEDEEDEMNPPRVPGVRPRSSRSGMLQPPPLHDDFDDDEDEDSLPPAAPVYDQPTRVPQPQVVPPVRPLVPQAPAASEGSRTPTGNRGPQPVALPRNRAAQSGSRTATGAAAGPPQKPAQGRPRQQTGNGVNGASRRNAQTPSARPARQSATRQKRPIRDFVVPILVGLLIFLILAALAYTIPSADITVGVPFKSFSTGVQLAANAAGKTDTTNANGARTASATSAGSTPVPVTGQTLTFDGSISDKGHASGSAPIGNAVASGTVNFSNKSSQSIHIPTGTQLATNNNVVFVTTLDVIVPPNGSSYVPPVTVQAQTPGTVGNVAANTIVTITSAGQQHIMQFNQGLSSTSVLGVTNPQATTGGGAGHATAISQQDVNTLKSSLNTKIQTQFNNWLAGQLHNGDQAGKPTQQETMTTTPAVNSVVSDGTFSGTLHLHATILVVRSAAIQAAATTAVNTAVKNEKTYSNYTLYQPQQLQITRLTATPSSDGKSLTLKFTAQGQIIPNVSADQVRSLLVGKRVSQVQSTLTGPGGMPGVVTSLVSVNPSFFPWMPFWAARINVHIVPAQTPTTPRATASPTPVSKKKK